MKLVTFEQKEKLKGLGYPFDGMCYCGGAMDCICDYLGDEYKSIPVSGALDWLREEKGIMCYVDIVFKPTTQKAYYIGKILSPSGLIIWRKTSHFDSHSLAESALLDEIIKHLEK